MHPHGRLPTPNSRHNHCNRRPTRSRNTSPRTAPAARRRHIRRCNRPARTRARAPRENEKARSAAPAVTGALRGCPATGQPIESRATGRRLPGRPTSPRSCHCWPASLGCGSGAAASEDGASRPCRPPSQACPTGPPGPCRSPPRHRRPWPCLSLCSWIPPAPAARAHWEHRRSDRPLGAAGLPVEDRQNCPHRLAGQRALLQPDATQRAPATICRATQILALLQFFASASGRIHMPCGFPRALRRPRTATTGDKARGAAAALALRIWN